jgi:hypothetical protein
MYGNGWEDANDQITSANFSGSAAAYIHDQIVYDGTAFEVWEYPLYIDDSGVPADYLIVRFPVLENGTSPLADTTTGDYPGKPWYDARHQAYNIWPTILSEVLPRLHARAPSSIYKPGAVWV